MKEPKDPLLPRKRFGKLSCLAIVVGAPLLLVLCVYLIYTVNNRPPAIVIPTPVLPPNNAWDDFIRAGQMAKAMKHKSPLSMPLPRQQAYTFANYQASAEEARPILAILHNALSKPCVHPPIRSFYSSPSEGGAALRELARTGAGAAGYYALVGKPGRAADILLDVVEMGTMTPGGGPLLGMLVGTAVQAIGSSRIEILLPKLSSDELGYVAERLDRIADKRVSYADIVIEDGWTDASENLEEMAKPRSLDERYDEMRFVAGVEAGKRPTARQAWKMVRYAFSNKTAMFQENLSYNKAVAEEARRPYTGASRVKVPDNYIAQIGGGFIANQPRAIYLAEQVVIDLLRIEVALLRYHAANGRYPQQLPQLAPAYLTSLPDDPFGGGAGRPFRYRLTDNGKRFLLYSLGSDLKDDSGLPKQWPTAEGPGDIVAGKLYQPVKWTYP